MNTKVNNKQQLSIGALAQASGVPVETLRNWEKRYGFPRPTRLASGHRRYSVDTVSKLRLLHTLVGHGHRPRNVVVKSEAELRALVPDDRRGTNFDDPLDEAISLWHHWVERMDGPQFQRVIARDFGRLGARKCIYEMVIPFLVDLGERWERGEITVAHEHFASEVLMYSLSSRWSLMQPEVGKKTLILANQEGELHVLGIHLAAMLATLNDCKVVFLGANTPPLEIIEAARSRPVDAVVIGLSAMAHPDTSAVFLTVLRDGLLQTAIPLLYGGSTSVPPVPGVVYLESLHLFDRWLHDDVNAIDGFSCP